MKARKSAENSTPSICAPTEMCRTFDTAADSSSRNCADLRLWRSKVRGTTAIAHLSVQE